MVLLPSFFDVEIKFFWNINFSEDRQLINICTSVKKRDPL